MTRLAITADLHCDDFGSKLDPSTGMNARWVDSIDMARWVATDARARGADALIVAGDLTEARHPAPWRVDMIHDALEAFGGPVKLLRGNHDGERHGHSIVDELARGRPGWDGFSRPGVTVVDDVAVAMLPYLDRHHLRGQPGFEAIAEADLLRVLADQFVTIAGGLYAEASKLAPRRVLVVHQGLSGGQMSEAQQAFLGDKTLVVDSRALGAIGFEAILAGHFHLHQVLSTDPLIAYAGAPTRTDFGEALQRKGYLIVDTAANGYPLTMAFIETPARRFVTLTGAEIEDDVAEEQVDGAVVRVVDLDEYLDAGHVRTMLTSLGAWDVQEIRIARPATEAAAGGMSEDLAPAQALEEYFASDPDREALVELGRGILAEVA